MKHLESRKFVFSRPPTGTDVAELIKENEFYGWEMKIEQRSILSGMSNINPYVYDVTFEKERA